MGRRLPALSALYRKYARYRDRFEIFAFHNGSTKTLEELDAKLKDIVEKKWAGRQLPFPILLDATGTTYRNFSVRSLGTCVLVSPEGKVVRGDGEKILEGALEELAREGDVPR